MRLIMLLGLSLSVLSGANLFYIKYQVAVLEKNNRKIKQEILQKQDEVRVLRAEWAYLNTPERLKKLASRYLDLKPAQAKQVLNLKKVSLRQPY